MAPGPIRGTLVPDPPRWSTPQNVPSVMAWAVEAVADYVENIRPRFGCESQSALWVTERGGRVKPTEINARFVAYRGGWAGRRPREREDAGIGVLRPRRARITRDGG